MDSSTAVWVFGLLVFVGLVGGQIGGVSGVLAASCRFPAIYNFGDSNSDTGGKSAAMDLVPQPNGRTFFGKPSGRVCDGRLIIDFIAENLRLPYLSAYLDSIGTNFRHGANFATAGSPICPPGFSPFHLAIQISQFIQFKSRATALYNQVSSNIIGNDIKTICKKRHLPRPKDFSTLYTNDIGQNDHSYGFQRPEDFSNDLSYGFQRPEDYSNDLFCSFQRPEDFSKALYTIDIGQNDLSHGFQSTTEQEVRASIPDMMDNFTLAVHQLYKEGARVFWVHNTGPVGCLPYIVLSDQSKPENLDQNGCVKTKNEVAVEYNRQLKDRVSQLRVQLLDAAFTYVDMYSAKYALVANATNLGFDDPMEVCYSTINGTSLCIDPSKVISWDGIHYTEAANMLIAKLVVNGSLSDPLISVANACHTPMKS